MQIDCNHMVYNSRSNVIKMHIVVDTYGARVSFDDGIMIIEIPTENGHEKVREIPFLHVTSLHLYPHVRVSTHVLNYCIQSGIPVFLENDLEVTGLVWSPKYGSIAHIRKKQTLYSLSSLKFNLIKKVLYRKNFERKVWLEKESRKKEVLEKLKTFHQKNLQITGLPNDEAIIRSWEADLGKKFFEILKLILPRYCAFEKRIQPQATDPFNALLNYGYGMLYKEVTKAIIQSGMDPFTGMFHRDQYNRTAFTYDMVEPYRVWVEQNVVKFCKTHTGDVEIINPDNGRLTKPMRRKFVEQILSFMQTKNIQFNGKRLTPRMHIKNDMRELAKYFQNIDYETLLNHLRHQ